MRLIGAELPSGSFSLERGFSVQEIEAVLEDIWDVLYGVQTPRPGRGLLEIETDRGHYLFDRDLLSDELEITLFRGEAPPDDRLIAPGLWLLGTKRPTEDPSERLPLHLDEVQDLRLRSQRLQAKASALAEEAEAALVQLADEPLKERRRVEETLERLMILEAENIERELRSDSILGECLELLTTPREGGRATTSEAELLGLAERFEQLEKEEGRARAILRWRRFGPALAAAGLASGGLSAAGQVMGLVPWAIGGAVGTAMVAAPVVAAEWVGRQRSRRLVGRRAELLGMTEQALFKARAPELDGAIDSSRIREVARSVARRDILKAIRERLDALRIKEERRRAKERRAKYLREGMPEELQRDLIAHWEREPLMALPGILRELDQAVATDFQRRLAARSVESERTGAAKALREEADRLLAEAERLARMDAVVGFLQSLATERRTLPASLRGFLESLVKPASAGASSGFDWAERRSTAVAESRSTEASPLELSWPDLEAELERLEAGLDAAAARLSAEASEAAEASASWTGALPSALDRIEAWMAQSGDPTPAEGFDDEDEAEEPELLRLAVSANAIEPPPHAQLVDLRIAPLSRAELVPIAPTSRAPRTIAKPIVPESRPLVQPALHRAELPPPAKKAAPPKELPAVSRTLLEVAAAEGIRSSSLLREKVAEEASAEAAAASSAAPKRAAAEDPARTRWLPGLSRLAKMWAPEKEERALEAAAEAPAAKKARELPPQPLRTEPALPLAKADILGDTTPWRTPSVADPEDRLFVDELGPMGVQSLEFSEDVSGILESAFAAGTRTEIPTASILEIAEFEQTPAAPPLEPKAAPVKAAIIRHYRGGERRPESSLFLPPLEAAELPAPASAKNTREAARVREASKVLENWRRERLKALSREA